MHVAFYSKWPLEVLVFNSLRTGFGFFLFPPCPFPLPCIALDYRSVGKDFLVLVHHIEAIPEAFLVEEWDTNALNITSMG